MGLLTLFLCVLACLFGGLCILGFFRQRRPGEPPLDKGWIPWLGHVLEFRRDTAKFLQRMTQKHGDVFTIQLGGFYVTFLQDPLSFGAFAKESREKLNFNTFSRQLLARVFGYVGFTTDHSILEAASQKHLKGHGLQIMTESMMSNLQNLMLHHLGSCANQNSWKEDGLFNYCYNIVFRAGYLALYGNATAQTEGDEEKARINDRTESEILFHEFRKYDQLFPNLAYGVLTPKGRREANRLTRFFEDSLSMKRMKNKENVSGWIWDMSHMRREEGMKELMIDRYMFVLLWASQGNTGPSSFWLLLYLMKHPDAMEAVRNEVRPGGPLVNLTHEMLMKTPVLDSAVEEVLRLVAAPLLTRSVLQNMTLKMADGREFLIRKGDRMAVFPYIAVHIDPEIHPDPFTFKYDRFLTPEGTKKTDFYKRGKRVRYYTMPWGLGCLCQFVFLMLVYFDFELMNPDEKIPHIDHQRWGFGTMQPDREVQFRYRAILPLV
uniref:Cytochrome P450 family 8 subfamily B member 1 n=1 Tax=Neogobius melanostomus TaxID=47308 RepID=A0A8C6U1L9_9GOBI